MSTLKEAIAVKHKAAEETDFAKLLISGDLSRTQWDTYLFNMYHVHDSIERRGVLEKKEVLVCPKINVDLAGSSYYRLIASSALNYSNYLLELPVDKLWAHVYVHYLGHMYGGQYIKKNIKYNCSWLNFDDHKGCIEYIREKTKDADHDEANVAFDYMIDIYDEIYQTVL